MKLSELSTDRTLDVLCELTPYVSNIVADEDVVSTLGKPMDLDKGLNLYGQVVILAGRIGEITPLLLKTHRADVYGVLSVVNRKTVEEIAAQPFKDTVEQVREVFQDTELLTFFRSFAPQDKTAPSAPSAKSPS